MPEQLSFASWEEHAGDSWRRENADVPRAAAGDVAECFEAEAGQPHLDRDETSQYLGMLGGEAVDGAAGDVLRRKVDWADPEADDHLVEHLGGGVAVEVLTDDVGVAEAGKVDRDDTVVAARSGMRW